MKRWWWRLAYTLRALWPWRRRTRPIPGEMTLTIYPDVSGFKRSMEEATALLAEAGRLSADDAQAIADRVTEVFALGPNATEVLEALAAARAPHRIQMSRQHPWRADNPDAVMVSRPGKWGNPISISDVAGQFPSVPIEGIARMVVRDFRALATHGTLHLPNWRFSDGHRGPVTWTYPSVDEIRAELRGRDLACWCALDEACHADVLLEIANS